MPMSAPSTIAMPSEALLPPAVTLLALAGVMTSSCRILRKGRNSVSRWPAMPTLPGWPGSAVPGQLGNAVFAGHRVTHTHPFLRINELVGPPRPSSAVWL